MHKYLIVKSFLYLFVSLKRETASKCDLLHFPNESPSGRSHEIVSRSEYTYLHGYVYLHTYGAVKIQIVNCTFSSSYH